MRCWPSLLQFKQIFWNTAAAVKTLRAITTTFYTEHHFNKSQSSVTQNMQLMCQKSMTSSTSSSLLPKCHVPLSSLKSRQLMPKEPWQCDRHCVSLCHFSLRLLYSNTIIKPNVLYSQLNNQNICVWRVVTAGFNISHVRIYTMSKLMNMSESYLLIIRKAVESILEYIIIIHSEHRD